MGYNFIVLMNVCCCHRVEGGHSFCSFCVLLTFNGIDCCVLLSNVVYVYDLFCPWLMCAADLLADGFSESSICKGFYHFMVHLSSK